jgi:hypothetical protein
MRTIDDVFGEDASIDDSFESENFESGKKRHVTFEEFKPEKYERSEENSINYTSTDESELEKRLAKPKQEKREQKKEQPYAQKKITRRKAIIHAILPYVPVLPKTENKEPFRHYFSSQHYKDLENYLETVEERKALPLLDAGRIDLRRRAGAVAAMHPTERGAYITIDTDYERHLHAMARGYRVPSKLSLEERADALRDYTLDHENMHRYQKDKILAGTPEVALERDVEATLWKFYNHQMNAYKHDPTLVAKYGYLRGIAEQRFHDVKHVYGDKTVKAGKSD